MNKFAIQSEIQPASGRTSPDGFSTAFRPCAAPQQSFSATAGVRSQEELSAYEPTMAALVLEDGSVYLGYSFGSQKASVSGELVFQTGMTGYPEALTDPSNTGYLLVMTFPLIGNYGVPDTTSMDSVVQDRLEHFESNKIHVSALVVGQYSAEYSHYMAKTSLSQWLVDNEIPAVYGIDTREVTKKIREQGAMKGKLLFPKFALGTQVRSSGGYNLEGYEDVSWRDINIENLAAKVSTQVTRVYYPSSDKALKHPSGRNLRILAVDFGLKKKQIVDMVEEGLEVKLVPWDYDFLDEEVIDGLFLSNGPGNPEAIPRDIVVKRIEEAIRREKYPIFGICMGHQLLSLASGAKTIKMKYGNRGANIPCTDLRTGKCYITSQNHGFAVEASSFKKGIVELFVNANDGTNEGMMYEDLPYFSVQFHPEATPGPEDTRFLFKEFSQLVEKCSALSSIRGVRLAGNAVDASWKEKMFGEVKTGAGRVVNGKMIRKVLVLGSGGLSIGQAGEFDYSGSQAIKALKEEGIYTVLINPNIATIQTSKGLADKCYFLPVTPEYVRKVIEHERPDGIFCTFGGQTALNIGVALNDEFEALGVQVLGTQISTINTTEDRELFAKAMEEIGEKCARSDTATTVEEALAVGEQIGYPVIVRAAYALGGLGSGFADNAEQLEDLAIKALQTSPQILVERSMKGWKEIEYEVVRDSGDNCIVVCNMENFDPLGIHTGDSIVIAPSQTLDDNDMQMLRSTAIKVVRHLGVVGECNIQYALNPNSNEYCIIEVNARLSRSSALASKATGYPLAFVAAKLGLGIKLNTLRNSVTKVTTACFEPSLDYVVVKMPRWDLAKFQRVNKELSSAMKSVGEVMAIGKTFEECLMEAIRSVDPSFVGFGKNDYVSAHPDAIDRELVQPTDKRLFAIANAFYLGYSVEKVWELTRIDKWFLCKLRNIIETEILMAACCNNGLPKISPSLLTRAKMMGFSDLGIAQVINSNELQVRKDRLAIGLHPYVKQIDTVAAEFPATTNYLYLTYNASTHDVSFEDHGIMVLGSGVYRIGSSVEFDWCAVRAIKTLRENGKKTIMVNYNPETVSTDYDEADRLYFCNITLEKVMDIYMLESSAGVVISMGGQTPNNIALALHRQKVKIFGTSPDYIDNAENRYKFSRMLDQIGIDQPAWRELTKTEDAFAFCRQVGFPVLVRPSYVLSGAAMNVAFSEQDLDAYLKQAVTVSKEYPVVITKFIEDAKEIDVDAVAINGQMVVHCISEHVENAGVHSGDATLVLPPQDLDPVTVKKISEATAAIGKALHVTGPYNIQFIAKDNMIKVIECNVRAARSFPFVSKSMNVDFVEIAVKAMLGLPVSVGNAPTVVGGSKGWENGQAVDYVAVKVPQFSFSRLLGADPILGVEMASTGEVAAFGRDKYDAYIKALLATGFTIPKKNVLVSIGSYKEKVELLDSIRKLVEVVGLTVYATPGTADFFNENNVNVKVLDVSSNRAEYSMHQHLANNLIDLYINLPSKNQFRRPANFVSEGYKSRRMAIDCSIPLITNVKCAKMFAEALARYGDQSQYKIRNLDYITSHRTIVLPGLVDVCSLVAHHSNLNGNSVNFDAVHSNFVAALCGGFSMLNVVCPLDLNTHSQQQSITSQYSSFEKLLTQKCKSDYSISLSMFSSSNLGEASQPLSKATEEDLLDLARANPREPLFISMKGRTENYSRVAEIFRLWPRSTKIITDATGAELASTLLLASLYDRCVHVTNVTNSDDLLLILLSKDKNLNVTFDVSIFSLFPYPQSDSSSAVNDANTKNRLALWEKFDDIDCLSVGNNLPQQLKDILNNDYNKCMQVAYSLALPLLLNAVSDNLLTIDDIVTKLSTNPRKIFNYPLKQSSCYIEAHTDKRTLTLPQAIPNLTLPLNGDGNGNDTSAIVKAAAELYGNSFKSNLHRVVFKAKCVFLDGKPFDTIIDSVSGSTHQLDWSTNSADITSSLSTKSTTTTTTTTTAAAAAAAAALISDSAVLADTTAKVSSFARTVPEYNYGSNTSLVDLVVSGPSKKEIHSSSKRVVSGSSGIPPALASPTKQTIPGLSVAATPTTAASSAIASVAPVGMPSLGKSTNISSGSQPAVDGVGLGSSAGNISTLPSTSTSTVATTTSATAPILASSAHIPQFHQNIIYNEALLADHYHQLTLKSNFVSSILSRFDGYNPFYRQSLVSAKSLTRNHLYILFAVAMEIRTLVEKYGVLPLLSGKIMTNLFYEPSSRTNFSFQTAMSRLGGKVNNINVDASSVTKGETLHDTIKTFSCYSDIIVLRHPKIGAAKAACESTGYNFPIINAGDGAGEHPTQALLDVFTIREELGTVNGLVVTLVGDLCNGRTVHSLARLLTLYNNITINYVAPTEALQMPDEIISKLNQLASPNNNFRQFKHNDLSKFILSVTDVLYVTRIQKERFESVEQYNNVLANFTLTIDNSVLSHCKKNMIVMHPLPRVNEISPDVDTDPRAAYFRQMKYGMYVRMALLSLIFTN
ncbi:Protein pyrABCN [Zancudomyces culisetae]|uniref:Protein pyrABCN n=1 Tax=Zancudomyces culisetae TaxID=1213189 RepID=A0A1R1PX92_ZANCU|nr:Protein pyrABCN [Zancudomyces culisetae]|eukprot:OMH85528.1 Protein pyrABCN [Zancudomyces culisetae]